MLRGCDKIAEGGFRLVRVVVGLSRRRTAAAHQDGPFGSMGMRVVVAAVVVVVMGVRTGLIVALSTPGLAGVAAARLQVPHLDPGVARRQAQLAAQRHRLPPVGEEATYRGIHLGMVAQHQEREGMQLVA